MMLSKWPRLWKCAYLRQLLFALSTFWIALAVQGQTSIEEVRLSATIDFLNRVTGTYAPESLEIQSYRNLSEAVTQASSRGFFLRVFITSVSNHKHPYETFDLTSENLKDAKIIVEEVYINRSKYEAESRILTSFELSKLDLSQQSFEAQWPHEEPTARGERDMRINNRLVIDLKNSSLSFVADISGVGSHGAIYRHRQLQSFSVKDGKFSMINHEETFHRDLSVLSRWGQALGVRGEAQWKPKEKPSHSITHGSRIDHEVLAIEEIAARDGVDVNLTKLGGSQKYIGIKPLQHPDLPQWTREEIYSHMLDLARDDINRTPRTQSFQLEAFLDDFIARYHRQMGIQDISLGQGSLRTVFEGEPAILGRLLPQGARALEHRFAQLHWLEAYETDIRRALKGAGLSVGSVEMDLLVTEALFFAIRLQAGEKSTTSTQAIDGMPKQAMLARLHLEVISAALERLELHRSIPTLTHQLLSLVQEHAPLKLDYALNTLREYRTSYKYHQAKRLLSNGVDIYTSSRAMPPTRKSRLCRSVL